MTPTDTVADLQIAIEKMITTSQPNTDLVLATIRGSYSTVAPLDTPVSSLFVDVGAQGPRLVLRMNWAFIRARRRTGREYDVEFVPGDIVCVAQATDRGLQRLADQCGSIGFWWRTVSRWSVHLNAFSS